MVKKDLTGEEFNGVKAVKFDHQDSGGRAYWVFRCHCSKHFISQGYKVTSGHTKSCGCIRSLHEVGYSEKIRLKIKKKVKVSENGCWEWQGSLKTTGYSQIVAFGKPQCGHRVSYKVFRGDIPKDLWVLHSCDNRKCVNPDHLFLGNGKENHFDMTIKGRSNYAKNEKSGHAKLTKNQVLEARKLYETGLYGCSVLSKKYGVTSRTIWCAIKNITWKDIENA